MMRPHAAITHQTARASRLPAEERRESGCFTLSGCSAARLQARHKMATAFINGFIRSSLWSLFSPDLHRWFSIQWMKPERCLCVRYKRTVWGLSVSTDSHSCFCKFTTLGLIKGRLLLFGCFAFCVFFSPPITVFIFDRTYTSKPCDCFSSLKVLCCLNYYT